MDSARRILLLLHEHEPRVSSCGCVGRKSGGSRRLSIDMWAFAMAASSFTSRAQRARERESKSEQRESESESERARERETE